uniref:collagen alpha-1(I) chain-like n=1 Tax=Halichoerus grypus TaxID=9711 RepID=UPI001659F00C|nr:collagen alpha-1(I) chain-like [Halichoerus grypus]
MERREPGAGSARGAAGGGPGRRGRARERAGAEGPGLGRRRSGSRRRGGRAPWTAGPGLAPPRLAPPLRAAPGRPAPPPPASLAPGPAARAHTLGRRRPHAERCDGRAQAAAGPGPCGVCPEPGPGGASRAPAGFIGSPASPTASSATALRGLALRRPAPPPQGCTYVVGDPRPGGGRGSHPPGGGSAASPRAGGPREVAGNKAQGPAVPWLSDRVILVQPAFPPGAFKSEARMIAPVACPSCADKAGNAPARAPAGLGSDLESAIYLGPFRKYGF